MFSVNFPLVNLMLIYFGSGAGSTGGNSEQGFKIRCVLKSSQLGAEVAGLLKEVY